MRSELAATPVVARFALVGATAAFLLGCLLGLVVGLVAYPPTAWFAVIEAGVIAAILGAVPGALAGVVTAMVQRLHRD